MGFPNYVPPGLGRGKFSSSHRKPFTLLPGITAACDKRKMYSIDVLTALESLTFADLTQGILTGCQPLIRFSPSSGAGYGDSGDSHCSDLPAGSTGLPDNGLSIALPGLS